MSLENGLRDLLADLVAKEVKRQLASATTGLSAAEEFVTVRAAAAIASLAPGTIRRWIREGKLARHGAGRMLRVRRADVLRLLDSGRRAGDAATPEELADLEDRITR